MTGSPSRYSLVARVTAAAILAYSIASCEGAAQLTPVPWNGELRYGGVDDGFCDLIRWDDIASELDLRLGESEPSPYSGPFWGLDCTVRGFAAEYADRSRSENNRALLGVRLFEHAGEAHTFHRTVRHATAGRLARDNAQTGVTVTLIDDLTGWWAQGMATQTIHARPGRDHPDGSVVYQVHHENLILVATVAAQGLDDEGAAANLHEAALAMIDEAKARIPCRSLVDPPVPDCE